MTSEIREEKPPQDHIDLQDWLKLIGWVSTGGEAKMRIQGGEVYVNGELETRRRRKLRQGDRVRIEDTEEEVCFE